MDSFEEKYCELLSILRPRIVSELQYRYMNYCSDFTTGVWRNICFADHIMVPAAIIFVPIIIVFQVHVLPHSFTLALVGSIVSIVIAVFLILHISSFLDSVSSIICQHFFEKYEYKKIVLLCLTWSKERELEKADSEMQENDIVQFYSRCEYHIVDEFFDYQG